MTVTDLSTRAQGARLRHTVTLAGICSLLFLRLPVETGFGILHKIPAWLLPSVEIAAYGLTAFLIWWERDRLSDFHLDPLALGMVLLFKPIETLYLGPFWRTRSILAFPRAPALAIWAIAAVLLLALLAGRHKSLRISRRLLLWLAIGAGAGLALAVLLGYPAFLQTVSGPLTDAMRRDIRRRLPLAAIPVRILTGIPYQLGYAAAYEEPIFRGFLWGYLRNLGWKHVWILFLQAALFSFGHLYYLGRLPFSFWVIVPVGGLAFGLAAWRSRSIATSMVTHGVMNAATALMGSALAGHVF